MHNCANIEELVNKYLLIFTRKHDNRSGTVFTMCSYDENVLRGKPEVAACHDCFTRNNVARELELEQVYGIRTLNISILRVSC
jgi:hypothetical protein